MNWRSIFLELWRSVPAELRLLSWHGARARESLKASLSVLLAVALAQALGLHDLWWVAFSSYTVLRAGLPDTLTRGLYRIAGTCLGAIAGVGIALTAGHSPALIFGWTFAVIAVSIDQAVTSKYSYAWIFTGITNVIVLAASILPGEGAAAVARLRVIDVALGTATALAVGLLFEGPPLLRISWFSQWFQGVIGSSPVVAGAAEASDLRWRLLRHCAEGAAAVTCVTAIGYALHIAAFIQASVSILVVMVVPLPAFAADRGTAMARKMVQRACGCLCGGSIGILLLYATARWPLLWWPTLVIGVWIGQHIQNGPAGISYFGTQFCLGYLTAFVHDPRNASDLAAPTQRLLGILLGLLILGAILALSGWLDRCRLRRGQAPLP